MFKIRFAALLPACILLAACSSKPDVATQQPSAQTAGTPSGGFLLQPQHEVFLASGDFANNPAAEQFINKMVSKHGFDRQQLHEILSQARRLDSVLRLMDKQAPSAGPTGPTGFWLRYRKQFITPDNVQNGVAFMNQYRDALDRAQRVYGVPPEIIVGIIGVETRWGRILGKTRILDALATLSFNYPRRADYFSGELETFLLMARDENRDPLSLSGSFAGAMGYGQFMPSSYKEFAVDFNGDGHIDLWDPVDAIGSVANYFKAHGWVPGDLVAVPASGQAPGLKSGFNTSYSMGELAAAGLRPLQSPGNHQQASLIRLDVGTGYEYWYGLPNFYAITRYNHSANYAMAVWQLGQAVALAAVR